MLFQKSFWWKSVWRKNLISGEKPKEPEIMEKNDSEDIPDVEIMQMKKNYIQNWMSLKLPKIL